MDMPDDWWQPHADPQAVSRFAQQLRFRRDLDALLARQPAELTALVTTTVPGPSEDGATAQVEGAQPDTSSTAGGAAGPSRLRPTEPGAFAPDGIESQQDHRIGRGTSF